MKTLLLVLSLLCTWQIGQAQGAGKDAMDKIIEQLDRTKTTSTDQEKLVKELKEAAKAAGEAHPLNAVEAKNAFKKKLKEIRNRKSRGNKPGGDDNKEVKNWINDLENTLDNKGLISFVPDYITDLLVSATGTNSTSGHIGNLQVTNPHNFPVSVLPQSFYMPSDGNYQSYVGRTPDGITIPPGATVTVPIDGMCIDVTRPPVPTGVSFPPVTSWISKKGPALPPPMPNIPMPWSAGDMPVIPPVPSDYVPDSGYPVILVTGSPVESFEPDHIPGITSEPGYTPSDETPGSGVIYTWPGTDIPVGGTFDPSQNPVSYAPVAIAAWEAIETAVDIVLSGDDFTTPFSNNPPREREAVIQQTLWWWSAGVTGEKYEFDDFAGKVYDQYEDNTGKPVSSLPEEQQENLDAGIADFWNTFQATGVEAKVISADSPGLLDPSTILATVTTPNCRCRDITFDLEVRRGGVVVHSGNHSSRGRTTARIPNFRYGDVLDVKINNINVNCDCTGAPCTFYPAESTNPNSPRYSNTDLTRPGKVDIEMDNDPAGEYGSKGNHNCQNRNKTWNAGETEYTFTLETRDEGTNNSAVFQRVRIKSYCQLDGCRRSLCDRYIQLNFVTAR